MTSYSKWRNGDAEANRPRLKQALGLAVGAVDDAALIPTKRQRNSAEDRDPVSRPLELERASHRPQLNLLIEPSIAIDAEKMLQRQAERRHPRPHEVAAVTVNEAAGAR